MEPREEQLAHLAKLADALRSQGVATDLITKASKPFLKVANPDMASLNERVLCQQGADGSWLFWWPWQQRIGPVDDLDAVVGKIASVLRPVEADGASG